MPSILVHALEPIMRLTQWLYARFPHADSAIMSTTTETAPMSLSTLCKRDTYTIHFMIINGTLAEMVLLQAALSNQQSLQEPPELRPKSPALL